MTTTSLLDAIRVVKENERIAYVSYRDAAKKITNSAGRFVFEELSKIEQIHYERVTDLENSLERDGRFIDYQGTDFPLPPVLDVPAAREPDQKSVVTILSEAIELEENAKKAYADLAAKVSDPQGKQMFTRLADEEYRHFLLLVEAYWSVSYLGDWKWMR